MLLKLELELYRKCIKTTQQVIDIDKSNLRAYLLKGKALIRLGKDNQALSCFDDSLNGPESFYGDVIVASEIYQLSESLKLKLSMNASFENKDSPIVNL